LTSPGCRSGHYQTRVYPAPESPQALGLVTQSLHHRCWCAYSGHLLLGAPTSSQTERASDIRNKGGAREWQSEEVAKALFLPGFAEALGKARGSWFLGLDLLPLVERGTSRAAVHAPTTRYPLCSTSAAAAAPPFFLFLAHPATGNNRSNRQPASPVWGV
jgi:hypothetical protein